MNIIPLFCDINDAFLTPERQKLPEVSEMPKKPSVNLPALEETED